MKKRAIHLFLATALLLGCVLCVASPAASATSASPSPEPLGTRTVCKRPPCTQLLHPTPAVFTPRLAVQVGVDGTFNMGAFPDASGGKAPNSWDLMFSWPDLPGTSFTTLRIDGADSVYGSTGTQTVAPTNIDAVTNKSQWQIDDIEVTQVVRIVLNNQTGQQDVAQIDYTLRNTGTTTHSAGARVMIDDEINYTDGALFRLPVTGIVTQEAEFNGPAVPATFQTFATLTDSIHVAASTLKQSGILPPDRLVLARWRGIFPTQYDYTIDPTADITGDSAYAVYWNPTDLAPGSTRTYTTFYGLAALTVDLRPPLALGVAGPARLGIVSTGYDPNPFTIVATVRNDSATSTTAVSNVELTLNLPAGLALAGDAATQTVGDLAVNQEAQVTWHVVGAQQQSELVLSYGVTANWSIDGTTDTKTVTRQITLPGVHQVYLPFIRR